MKALLIQSILLITVAMWLSGCANFGRKFKAFLNGGEATPAPVARKATNTFNSNNMYNAKIPNRQYKRVTKEQIKQESNLESGAGSLWVMEGQGAYLFSQNIMRMIGDPIAVRIDGDPKDQLSAKSKVIKDLMDKIESRRKAAMRAPAAATAKPGEKKKAEEKPKAAAKNTENPGTKSDDDFNVKSVPTRIVERLVDGNYRIKGSQAFMIGKREYKTIVTGIVRAEDFSEEGIAATKLLDPKFDIVSVRRGEGRL